MIEKAPASLSAKGLVKRFRQFRAVDNVDVTLDGNGITALIGANGAGKTTLFNLITGQLRPDEGTVHLNGNDVTGKSAHYMAKRGIGRSFQDVRLFSDMSVRENIAVYAQDSIAGNLPAMMFMPGRRRSVHRSAFGKADEILDYLKIADLRFAQAGSLGFAQQKLVAIGRLLSLRPRFLFLDEPASGLDPKGRDTLSNTITRLADDGYAVCFVEHNTHIVRSLATRVMFLGRGRIIADGTPDEVFSNPRLAEAYLGLA